MTTTLTQARLEPSAPVREAASEAFRTAAKKIREVGRLALRRLDEETDATEERKRQLAEGALYAARSAQSAESLVASLNGETDGFGLESAGSILNKRELMERGVSEYASLAAKRISPPAEILKDFYDQVHRGIRLLAEDAARRALTENC